VAMITRYFNYHKANVVAMITRYFNYHKA
jgi:hypothetical protein